LARRYGEGVALGRSIDDLDEVPKRMQARTTDDIKRVAGEFLTAARSVTGTLALPPESKPGAGPVATKQGSAGGAFRWGAYVSSDRWVAYSGRSWRSRACLRGC